MKKAYFAYLGMAALLLASALGCGRSTHGDDEDSESAAVAVVAVRIHALEARSFEDVITAPGAWRSSGELIISAPFSATVQSVRARVGDRVRKGETLGWLTTRESESALRGAELLQRQARDSVAGVEAARALELARRDLVRVPLVAPAAGVVLRRSAEAGSQVAEASELWAIAPVGSVVFEAHVSALDARRLGPGEPATIIEQGLPARSATLERILPATAAGDQATLAWLRPNRDGVAPEIGHFGTARITLGSPRRAVAVPDSALAQDDLTGQTRIAVVGHDQRARWVGVTLGMASEGWHELKAPALSAGTMVIIEGQHGLPDSTRVKVQS